MHENAPSTMGAQSLRPSPAVAWQAAGLLGSRTMCSLLLAWVPAVPASRSWPWHGHPCRGRDFMEDHVPHPSESPLLLCPTQCPTNSISLVPLACEKAVQEASTKSVYPFGPLES